MAVWRDGGFADDIWTTLDDAAPVPERGAIIVSFARWQADKATLRTRADPVGVSIAAGKDVVGELAEAAGRPLVALKFDKFADGRAFSYAELLRERHGFTGELRAVGEVLLDEIALMQRCGFTSFEVTDANTLRALKEGRVPKHALFYQPALGPREAQAGTRPWLRRAAS
jgi:phosphoadenosine phosphosulfate reductase